MASFQANQATCTSSIGLASSELALQVVPSFDLQVVPSSLVIPSLAIFANDRQDFPTIALHLTVFLFCINTIL